MAHSLEVGSVVVNFGTTAMVVGHFAAADGQPSEHDGSPILRALSSDRRRFIGDKWIADPAKCSQAPTEWTPDGMCVRHGLTPNQAGGCNVCTMEGGR